MPAGGFRWPRLSASVQIRSPRLFSVGSPLAVGLRAFSLWDKGYAVGTAEQWIREGKYALKWTRLPYHRFGANQVLL